MPPVIVYEIPRIIFIVARVAINGGIFIFVIIRPFAAPNARPTPIETNIARNEGTAYHEINMVVRHPARDINDPTERSMPLVSTTKVMAKAHSAVVEIVLRIIIWLLNVKNFDETI